MEGEKGGPSTPLNPLSRVTIVIFSFSRFPIKIQIFSTFHSKISSLFYHKSNHMLRTSTLLLIVGLLSQGLYLEPRDISLLNGLLDCIAWILVWDSLSTQLIPGSWSKIPFHLCSNAMQLLYLNFSNWFLAYWMIITIIKDNKFHTLKFSAVSLQPSSATVLKNHWTM